MLVSHGKRFIFTKTVKTGGTSAEYALQGNCLPPSFSMKSMTHPAYETEYGIVGARGRNARESKWWNHMPAREIREKLGADIWNSYYKFTIIRNPFDKVVSWYHFRNPSAKLLESSDLIKAFNTWILEPNASLGRDRNKYVIGGKFALDEVVRYETLVDDLGSITKKLGCEMTALPRLKSSQRGTDRLHYRKYYSEEARRLVEDSFDYECSEFEYEF
jgi:hypothetical protein